MSPFERTVFISYRREDRWLAKLVVEDLTKHGFDVFIDLDGIDSGAFAQHIVDNIRSRVHFVLILTPTALAHCINPDDWVRREIEEALAAKRNVVPLLIDGFKYEDEPSACLSLAPIQTLQGLQSIPVQVEYFEAAMNKLRTKFLSGVLAKALPKTPLAAIPLITAPLLGRRGVHTNRAISEEKYLRWFMCLGAATSVLLPLVLWQDQEVYGGLEAQPVNQNREQIERLRITEDSELVASGKDHLLGRDGVAQDDEKAVSKFRQAAEQGDSRGQSALGELYELGRGGLAKDEFRAAMWYFKAVAQGDALGQTRLGGMYERGAGNLTKDTGRAIELYRLAALQNNGHAREALERLGEK